VTFFEKLAAVAVVPFAAVPVTVLTPGTFAVTALENVTVPEAFAAIAGRVPLVPVDAKAVPPRPVGAAVNVCDAVDRLATVITGLTVWFRPTVPVGGVIPVISRE
jgi:hypothetical protein